MLAESPTVYSTTALKRRIVKHDIAWPPRRDGPGRAGIVRPGVLSRSSLYRVLKNAGSSGRPRRGPSAERRSFLVERAGDLWTGDVMRGPLVIAGGRLRKVPLSRLSACLDLGNRAKGVPATPSMTGARETLPTIPSPPKS